jgi:hypothetical protein
MSARAQALAGQFSDTLAEIAALIESVPDDLWTAPLSDEDRPISVVAYHIAEAIGFELRLLQAAAQGEDSPVTWDDIHAANASDALANVGVSREQALMLLRQNGALATAAVVALSDEQLDRVVNVPFLGGQVSVAQIVEWLLIGHLRWHEPGIRGALAGR